MEKYLLKFLVILPLIFAGCKSTITDPLPTKETKTKEELIPEKTQTIAVNNFSIQLDGDGKIHDVIWHNGSSDISVIFLAGLWIGMDQDGTQSGDIISDGNFPESNYTGEWNDKRYGVFYLEENKSYDASNWPVELGAQVNDDGTPKVYGDAMCWSALTSDTAKSSIPIYSVPVKNLTLTQELIAYTRDDLSSVFFVRYEIKNNSSADWNNVYAGFYSDTDLGNPSVNKTGYDSTRALTYTYEDSINNSAYSLVTGFAFLETPNNIGTTSHRIMRKNNYINPDFGEYDFTSPQQILYALQGLSNSGQPMINPITGQVTKFAFTGDPVSRTGWLDTKIDVRSMISSGPFSIPAQGTKNLTVVWIVNDGLNLQTALSTLKTKLDKIRIEPNLWQFN